MFCKLFVRFTFIEFIDFNMHITSSIKQKTEKRLKRTNNTIKSLNIVSKVDLEASS